MDSNGPPIQPIAIAAPGVIPSLWSEPAIPDVNFTAHVLRHADRLADHPALQDAADGRLLSSGTLTAAARRTAAGLATRPLAAATCSRSTAPTCPSSRPWSPRVAMAGGTTTTINPLYTVDELSYLLRDTGARMVVTILQLIGRARKVAREAGIGDVLVYGELTAEGDPPMVAIAPDDVVLLRYSSGTTAAEGGDRGARRLRRRGHGGRSGPSAASR